MTSLPSTSEALHMQGGYFDWLKRQAGLTYNVDDTGFGRVLAVELPTQTAATIGLGLTDWPTLTFQPNAWQAISSMEWNQVYLGSDHIVLESCSICWPDKHNEPASAAVTMWVPLSPSGKMTSLLRELTSPFRNWRLRSTDGDSVVIHAAPEGEFPVNPWGIKS